jgi:hypothetical protein
MILILSHIPLLGMIVSKRYPNIITTLGARWSSVYGCIYIISFIDGKSDALSNILLFMGILGIVFLAVHFMTQDEVYIPGYYEKIPSMDSLYKIVRSVPGYCANILQVALGKKDTLSWITQVKNTHEKDNIFREKMEEFFTDTTLFFPRYLIYIPFCNIIFIPKLLLSRNSRYFLAIGQ